MGGQKAFSSVKGMAEPEEAKIVLVKPITAGLHGNFRENAMNSVYWVIFMGLLINIPSLAPVLLLRKAEKEG